MELPFTPAIRGAVRRHYTWRRRFWSACLLGIEAPLAVAFILSPTYARDLQTIVWVGIAVALIGPVLAALLVADERQQRRVLKRGTYLRATGPLSFRTDAQGYPRIQVGTTSFRIEDRRLAWQIGERAAATVDYVPRGGWMLLLEIRDGAGEVLYRAEGAGAPRA